MSRAKFISWVTHSMVMSVVRAMSRSTSSTPATSSGSSAEVTSSSSSTSRLHRQRPGDGHPLLLAAGQLGRVRVALVGEADQLQQLAGPLLRLVLGQAEHVTGASVMFCSTFMFGKRLNCWKTMPIFLRTSRRCFSSAGTSLPSRVSCVTAARPST